MNSINLTIHNKEKLILDVLDGIFNNAVNKFELIICLDGCTDRSEEIVLNYLQQNKNKKLVHFNVLYANNVFETRANNICAKASQGDYIIIVQDDIIITEYGWDERILRPFKYFDDVFAVTANCAHNWEINPNSVDKNIVDLEPMQWCDILNHVDHANKTNTDRETFAIRDCVNRGPLAINRKDLETMGCFSEEIFKQDMDDHLLCFDMQKKLGKVVGFFHIDWYSKPEYGGTRNEHGQTKQWLFEAQHKNTRLVYNKHSETMKRRLIENRSLK